MNNNAAAIYGGGYNSDVTGDIFIHIKENSLISEETVWGGGTGDSTITGGVTITVDDSSEVIGEIRAGGNEGADVIGDVVITVSGGPQSACPTIFATGKGEDEDNPAQVDGNVSITLHGDRANVYTLDKFGEVTSDHTVTIILDDTDELSGAVRGDSKLGQHLYNHEKNTPTRTGNGASVIVKGDYTSTGIHGFPEVVIEDGGILREHLASGETLFDGVETVTIQEGGALDLLQSNEISGNFTCAGTLKMPAPISAEADICYLTGGSNVTVQEGAAYVPTKDNGAADADYVKGDVFLKQGTVYTEPSAKVDFAVSEAGQAKEYFTDDRAVTDESDITHEWFVDQTQYVTIRPADITVYTGGNSYDGVTDENGQIVSGAGLPEAGYLLTVPEEINDMLEGPGQAVDLAGHLTFTYGAKRNRPGLGYSALQRRRYQHHRPGGRNRPLYLPDGIGKGRPGSRSAPVYGSRDRGSQDQRRIRSLCHRAEQDLLHDHLLRRGGSGPRKGGVQRYSRTFRRDIYLPGQD
ncbi:MAG: hypothetical protein ACLRNQ_20775 [Flavonifractor plautii]